jgi:hypothetical protein
VGVGEGMRRDGAEWGRRCLRKVEDVEKVEDRGKGIDGHSSRLNYEQQSLSPSSVVV